MTWIIWMGPKSNANILISDKMENIASRKQSDLGAETSDAAPGSGVLGVLLQILQKQRAPADAYFSLRPLPL